jgi:hypothetical protein
MIACSSAQRGAPPFSVDVEICAVQTDPAGWRRDRLHRVFGAPEEIRTPDPQIRSLVEPHSTGPSRTALPLTNPCFIRLLRPVTSGWVPLQ